VCQDRADFYSPFEDSRGSSKDSAPFSPDAMSSPGETLRSTPPVAKASSSKGGRKGNGVSAQACFAGISNLLKGELPAAKKRVDLSKQPLTKLKI